MNHHDTSASELRVVRHALAIDQPGPAPKDLTNAELPQFMTVRDQYDKPLQIAGAIPIAPQASCRSVADYERQLLADLARKSAGYTRLDCASIPDEMMPRYRERIVGDAMGAPHREGVLREVITTDRVGREIHEFVGLKTWLSPFRAPAFRMVSMNDQPVGVLPTIVS